MDIRPALRRGLLPYAIVLSVLVTVLCSAATASAYGGHEGTRPSDPRNDAYLHRLIDVQLLGINDFHGQLETVTKVSGRDTGRADVLAAYLKAREAENPKNTLMVLAGDFVGASPPISSLLKDEPTIDILNRIGFDVGTVGNHEFDDGTAELLRLAYGGDPAALEDFAGAAFPMTVANVEWTATGEPILPPYVIRKVNGIPIAFIGVVTLETPGIVMPSSIAGLTFTDPAEAIDEQVAVLSQMRVEAIVVLAHMGGTQTGEVITGEVADLAMAIDDEVDVIFAGHNHGFLNGQVDGKLVVESYSYGTAFSDVDLRIDPYSKDVVSKSAEIVTTFHTGIEPDAGIAERVAYYRAMVAPLIDRVVGESAVAVTRTAAPSGESALGDLIADAQRWRMGTDFAFMNPGGIRADLNAGPVTWGELFAIQPFGNAMVRMDLTGAQVRTLLEQQFQPAISRLRILQVSGLSYSWVKTGPFTGVIGDILEEDGTPLDPAATYSVAVNAFLSEGGDGFLVLKNGTGKTFGPLDLDALVDYVQTLPVPFTAILRDRIALVP